ncbi:MAG: M2 family metallopeptidase [Capsulimonadaceae bacterium]|nr:M2 family metallopeptidase [Capsulimonadaceae bacterium]
MTDLSEFIKRQQEIVETIERDSQQAYWDATVTGDSGALDRAAGLQASLDLCYSSVERRHELLATAEPLDESLARQRKILLDSFARAQMSPEAIYELSKRSMTVESIFANFRAKLKDVAVTDNDLKAVLRRSSDSSERREAWEASKVIGSTVEGELLDLVALRNREAQAAGYPDYYVMQIRLQELDEIELFRVLENVSRSLTPSFVEYKAGLDATLSARFGVTIDELRPWHYEDPFFQDAPSADSSLDDIFERADLERIASRFYQEIGLPIDHLLKRADLYERSGKSQHAFCMAVGRGTGDIRVACNLRGTARWMETLLHEFGHAVYDDLVDRDLPFFLRTYSHILTTEAIAEMMGRFVSNAAWLRAYAGVPAGQAAEIERQARAVSRGHLLVFTQWVQVMTQFERELYANPSQDLNKLWWDLVETHQRLKRPEGRNEPDWAAKIHLATAPAYYHNYLLGEMMASQILRTLRSTVAGGSEDRLVSDPAVGGWLAQHIFRPGSRYSWNDLIARATGEPLNPAYLVAEVID